MSNGEITKPEENLMIVASPTSYIKKSLDPKLKEDGKIKIGDMNRANPQGQGEKKWHYPVSFNYFLIVEPEKDSDGFNIVNEEVMSALGVKEFGYDNRGIPITTPEIKELDVWFAFNLPELNLRTAYQLYSGKERRCSGNGVSATRKLSDGTIKKVDCTCPLLDEGKCKPMGILHLVLAKYPTIGSVFTFRTTGWNTVGHLQAFLSQLGSMTDNIMGVPLKLSVEMKKSTKKDGGKTITRIYPVVSLSFKGSQADFISQGMHILEGNVIDSDKQEDEENNLLNSVDLDTETPEEQAEISDEFYNDHGKKQEDLF